MASISTVILAAGKGTRMKSDLAKVLHPLNRRPMVHYVVDAAREIGSQRTVLIVGHQEEKVRAATSDLGVDYATQSPQLGTGHAVMQAAPFFQDYDGDVLVLSGDVPLLRAATLRELITCHHEKQVLATLLTTEMSDPAGYGRVIRDGSGAVVRIVEDKDANDAERSIREINVGIYVFNGKALFETLPQVKNDNKQGEYYLPDVLKLYVERGERLAAVQTPDVQETHGINTVEQLKNAEQILLGRLKGARP